MRAGILICFVAVGIALILFSRIHFLHEVGSSASTVDKKADSEVGATDPEISTAAIPTNYQSNQLQSADAPATNAEVTPSAEVDPEKLADEIAGLSEAEVRTRLESLPSQELTGNTARLLLRRWVELDPTLAAGWVAQLPDATARGELTSVVGVVWSQKDLPAALTWAESLPEDDSKHRALTALGYEVARVDPLNAMQIAAQLPANEDSDALLLHALAQYASADPAQSQQLALSLPAGQMRDRVLSTMATIQAKQDGAQAAKFAIENVSPGPELERAVVGIVQIWGRSNPSEASAWVQTLSDPTLRERAMAVMDAVSGH